MKKFIISLSILAIFSLVTGYAQEDKEVINPPKKGYVTLSKEEYKKLLEMLKPREKESIKSPVEFVVNNAEYNLTINDDLQVTGSVLYELESLTSEKWIKAPLQENSRGINFNVPPEGLLLTYERGDNVYFGTNLKRFFKVSGGINMVLSKRDLNQYDLKLFTSRAVINRISIKFNKNRFKLINFPIIKIAADKEDGYEIYRGIAQPGMNLNFTLENLQDIKTGEGVEARIEGESMSLFNLESGLLQASYHFKFSLKHKSLDCILFNVPEGLEIYAVNGRGLKEWNIKNVEGKTQLQIIPEDQISDLFELFITGDKSYEGKTIKLDIPLILPLNIDRVKGTFAISVLDEAEVTTEKLEDVQEIDISELPAEYNRLPGFKPVLAYKYWWDKNDPYPQSVLNLKQYERVAVLTANIENAEFSSLLSDKGDGLFRARYWIRNNIKQNLKVTPPKGMKLWSCFVDNDPAKPTLDQDGSLLIPLKKSRTSTTSVFFPLEIIFYFQEHRMEDDGILKFELPVCDLQIMKLGWELLLPRNYEYEEWTGNFEQVGPDEYYRFITPAEKTQEKQVQVAYQQRNILSNQFAVNVEQQQEIARQTNDLIQRIQKRESYSRLREGRLPVKFQMPRTGKQFLFTKLLVVGKVPGISVEYELDD